MSAPPSIGPIAFPIPATPRISPPASPAFSSGSSAKVMPSTAGHISAPPIPIRARLAISQASDCAAPPSSEDRKDAGSEEEGFATAEQVGEPAAGHDQDAEAERICVDHPLGGGDLVSKSFSIAGRATFTSRVMSLAMTNAETRPAAP